MADRASSNQNGAKTKESRIDIEIIIFDIIRNWWVIVIGCLITAMLTYIYVSERYTPRYYAGATFVVSSRTASGTTSLPAANRLANQLTYVMESPVIRATVSKNIGIPSFDGTITARVVENTNLMTVFVIASSPQIAFDEMNGIIKYHHLISDSIMGNGVIDVLKAPTVPAGPMELMNRTPRILKNVLITGLALMALLIILSVASDRIMTESNLATRVDCPALATIRHEKKNLSFRAKLRGAKASMLITNPTTSFRFAETFRLFRTRLEYMMKRKGYKVLMVSSVLENEGKTTMTANIAIMLALNNKKVLLIDGDMLKPALYKLMGARIKRGTAINEVITNYGDFENIPKLEGLSTLSLLLGKTSLPNSTEIIGSRDMREFLKAAKEHYDYVIIDTPPIAFATDAECWAEIVDCSLLVIRQGAAKAKRINDCLEAIKQSGTEVLGCIFNNVYEFELFGTSSYGAKYDANFRQSAYYYAGSRVQGYGGDSGYGYGYGHGSESYGGNGSGIPALTPIEETEVEDDYDYDE